MLFICLGHKFIPIVRTAGCSCLLFLQRARQIQFFCVCVCTNKPTWSECSKELSNKSDYSPHSSALSESVRVHVCVCETRSTKINSLCMSVLKPFCLLSDKPINEATAFDMKYTFTAIDFRAFTRKRRTHTDKWNSLLEILTEWFKLATANILMS